MTALTTSTIDGLGVLRRHASALRMAMVIALLCVLAIVGVVLTLSGNGARRPAGGDPFSHSPTASTMPIVPGPVRM